MPGENRSLTAVPGISVGHAQDRAAATGCTAILGPLRAAVEVRGLATGSRELDALSTLHVVSRTDAILLTGGSAFGLAAADGVAEWLEERGRGFPTPAARVPIVPAAVLYDLGVGDSSVRPGPEMGRRAAEAAAEGPVPEGRVGAGAGATVGNFLGPDGAEFGGVGSWAAEWNGRRVAALAVVNAFGDVLDGRGRILAGCRRPDGSHLDTARALQEGRLPPGWKDREAEGGTATNTTLAVVATDRPLGRRALRSLARQAAGALSRRISPSGTLFDGDIVFAACPASASESPGPGEVPPAELVALAGAAGAVLERAIGRAVEREEGE